MVYSEKGAVFNIKKNYILNKLKIWAQDLAILKTLSGFLMFLIYYTLAVLYIMLNWITCQSYLIITWEYLNKYITNWEYVELLFNNLWNKLRAVNIKYNNILYPFYKAWM